MNKKQSRPTLSPADILARIVADFCGTTPAWLRRDPEGESEEEIRNGFAYLLSEAVGMSPREIAEFFSCDLASAIFSVKCGAQILKAGGKGALEIESLKEAWEIAMGESKAT